MIKRFIYWLTHPHKKTCKHCCVWCKYYERCKNDNEDAEEVETEECEAEKQ